MSVGFALSAGGVWMPKVGSAAPFTPASLPGLQFMMTMGQPSTLRQDAAGTTAVASDGDPIGRAADQSSNARAFTASGLVRPLFRTTAMGGALPCAQFDGTDDVLTTTGWSMPGAQTWTLDFQLTTTSLSFGCLLAVSDGTTHGALYVSHYGGYQSICWELGYTSANTAAVVGFGGENGALLDTARHRLVIASNGGDPSSPSSYRAFFDGAEVTVVASGGTGTLSAGATIGARGDGLPAPVRLHNVALHLGNYASRASDLAGWTNAA